MTTTTTQAPGTTRRTFIRGIAATGASTMAAVALDRVGLDLFGAESASAQAARTPFATFDAIAASADDVFEVPAGFRADVLIGWDDAFQAGGGEELRYGFNNDFLAYFPLRGSREGLIFVNHEYPDPFFLHGYRAGTGLAKTAEQIAIEQQSVGNSIVHVARDERGLFQVIRRSRYNRRITGASPVIPFSGPLRGSAPVGESANGSLANCSGGTTPWGTALSCEENYQDYGAISASGGYGWGGEYDPAALAKHGWVVEHDPYDPAAPGVKHTALGRFRHENTTFRQTAGKRFVVYMGDDRNNGGVYKFVSERAFESGNAAGNRQILQAGTLYAARWEPEGRRRFAMRGDTVPLSASSGTGSWVKVETEELLDTDARLRARFGTAEWEAHFGTNRPEDLELSRSGTVYIALTNNSTVNDAHGSIRALREDGADPEASTFTWLDYQAGGPSGRSDAGEQGFSAPDNLVFDRARNLWVVTDISSGSLNKNPEYRYHANNAVFMIPTSGGNRGVAFRFANMPIEAEATGPYFTPDGRSLFINVQHPGEETGASAGADPANPATFTSHWPRGSKTGGVRPQAPRPSTVAISPDPDGLGNREIPTPG